MLTIDLGASGLSQSRFAIAPLVELDQVLRALRAPQSNRGGRAGSARLTDMRRRLAELAGQDDVVALLALQRRDTGAGFVSPPPSGLNTTLDDQLNAVRSTPDEIARLEIGRAIRDQRKIPAGARAILTSAGAARQLAETLEKVWSVLLADLWPGMLAILERDVLHRAQRLSSAGWAQALGDLDARLRWNRSSLEVLGKPHGRIILEKGLVLIPSAGPQGGFRTYLEPISAPWPPAIVYSARASGLVWESPGTTTQAALGELLGPRRARILGALDEPSSTTQLADLLALPIGSVGDHLAVLMRAGLVSNVRVGRTVLYQRTEVGDALAIIR